MYIQQLSFYIRVCLINKYNLMSVLNDMPWIIILKTHARTRPCVGLQVNMYKDLPGIPKSLSIKKSGSNWAPTQHWLFGSMVYTAPASECEQYFDLSWPSEGIRNFSQLLFRLRQCMIGWAKRFQLSLIRKWFHLRNHVVGRHQMIYSFHFECLEAFVDITSNVLADVWLSIHFVKR